MFWEIFKIKVDYVWCTGRWCYCQNRSKLVLATFQKGNYYLDVSENNLKQFQHPRWKIIQIYSSRWWRISANNPETRGCSPNFWPSIGSWNADIADLYDPTVLYSKPLLKRSAKKSKMQLIGDLIGKILRLIHQLLHFCSIRHVTLKETLQCVKIVQIRSYF